MKNQVQIYEDKERAILLTGVDSTTSLDEVVTLLENGVEDADVTSKVDYSKYGDHKFGSHSVSDLIKEASVFGHTAKLIAETTGISQNTIESDVQMARDFIDRNIGREVSGTNDPFEGYEFRQQTNPDVIRPYVSNDGTSLETYCTNNGLRVLGVLENMSPKEENPQGITEYLSSSTSDQSEFDVKRLNLRKAEVDSFRRPQKADSNTISTIPHSKSRDLYQDQNGVSFRLSGLTDPNDWIGVPDENIYSGSNVPEIMKRRDHDYIMIKDGDISVPNETTFHVFEDGNFIGSIKARGMARELPGSRARKLSYSLDLPSISNSSQNQRYLEH